MLWSSDLQSETLVQRLDAHFSPFDSPPHADAPSVRSAAAATARKTRGGRLAVGERRPARAVPVPPPRHHLMLRRPPLVSDEPAMRVTLTVSLTPMLSSRRPERP